MSSCVTPCDPQISKGKVVFLRKLEIPIVQEDPGLVPKTPLPQGLSISSNQAEWFLATPILLTSISYPFPQIPAPSLSASWRDFYSPNFDSQPPTMYLTTVAKTWVVDWFRFEYLPLLLSVKRVSKHVGPDVLCRFPVMPRNTDRPKSTQLFCGSTADTFFFPPREVWNNLRSQYQRAEMPLNRKILCRLKLFCCPFVHSENRAYFLI